jgi:hypothetical protein
MKNVCPKCNSFILRPTCAFCLTDEIEAWLERKKISIVPKFKDQMVPLLESIKKTEKQRCSFCFMDTAYITCLYCFTKHIYEWLEITDKELSKEFVGFFKEFLKRPTRVYA